MLKLQVIPARHIFNKFSSFKDIDFWLMTAIVSLQIVWKKQNLMKSNYYNSSLANLINLSNLMGLLRGNHTEVNSLVSGKNSY
jgi:hypothetical protein